MKNYYKILGVSQNSSFDDIKKAYKSKVIEFHPDKNKSADSESLFKEVSNAYDVLSDKEKRASYDYSLLIVDPTNSINEVVHGFTLLFNEVNRVIHDYDKKPKSGSSSKVKSRKKSGNVRKSEKIGCDHCGFSGFVCVKQGDVSINVTCKYCS